MRGFDRDATGISIGKSGEKIGFFGATPAAQQTTLADLTITYTAADPSITPDGSLTVANGGTPTVGELLEGLEEAYARINALTAQIQALGL